MSSMLLIGLSLLTATLAATSVWARDNGNNGDSEQPRTLLTVPAPAVLGLPESMTVKLLCQVQPTVGDAIASVKSNFVGSQAGELEGLTLQVPSDTEISSATATLWTPRDNYGYFTSANGTMLSFPGTAWYGGRCSPTLSNGTVVNLRVYFNSQGDYYSDTRPGVDGVGRGINLNPDCGYGCTLPAEAFELCLRRIYFRYFDSYPYPRSKVSTMPLIISVSPATGESFNGSMIVYGTEVGCDGIHGRPSPLTISAVPGSVSEDPFFLFADSDCGDANFNGFILPTIVVPVTDPQDILGWYRLAAQRTVLNYANPLPMKESPVTAVNYDTSYKTDYATLTPAYNVAFSGVNMTVVETRGEVGPVEVTWIAVTEYYFPNWYPYPYTIDLCRADALGLSTFAWVPMIAPMFWGPSPSWAFQACLRTLKINPAEMPDGLGSYALNLTVQSPSFPEGAIRPFEVKYPCPSHLRTGTAVTPVDLGDAEPVTITWPVNCPAVMEKANRSLSVAIGEKLSQLVDLAPRLGIVESVSIGYNCSNCFFRGEAIPLDRALPYSPVRLSYDKNITVGDIVYSDEGVFRIGLISSFIHPNVTVRGAIVPWSGHWQTCSSVYPSLGGLPRTVGISKLNVSQGVLAAGNNYTYTMASQQLGNAVTSGLYPRCLEASTLIASSRADLRQATTQGAYSFRVRLSVDGYEEDTDAKSGVGRLITRSITVPLNLVLNNENCEAEPAAAVDVTPTFLNSSLTWHNAGCMNESLNLFHDAGLNFVPVPLQPLGPTPGDAATSNFMSAVKIACFAGNASSGSDINSLACPGMNASYIATGAIPATSPLRKAVRWSQLYCHHSYSNSCVAYCSVTLGTLANNATYQISMAGTVTREEGDSYYYSSPGFPLSYPMILAYGDWIPSEAFSSCLQDLRLVRNGTGMVGLPSALNIVVTGVRSDMIGIREGNNTLRITLPSADDSFNCSPSPSPGPGTSGASAVSSHSAPLVTILTGTLVPAAGIAMAAAVMALVVARRKKERLRVRAAPVAGSVVAVEMAAQGASDPAASDATRS
jgi:hypothetical protein